MLAVSGETDLVTCRSTSDSWTVVEAEAALLLGSRSFDEVVASAVLVFWPEVSAVTTIVNEADSPAASSPKLQPPEP